MDQHPKTLQKQPRPDRKVDVRAERDDTVRAWRSAAKRAVVSGAFAAVATSLWVALAGKREAGSAVSAINATSHIVWGNAAARVDRVDAKHTLVGTALNLGACIFWATLYEKAFGRSAERREVAAAVLGGAAVAAAAYVTDYHLVPQRLTPGWEMRLSRRSLGGAYALLALALPVASLMRGRT